MLKTTESILRVQIKNQDKYISDLKRDIKFMNSKLSIMSKKIITQQQNFNLARDLKIFQDDNKKKDKIIQQKDKLIFDLKTQLDKPHPIRQRSIAPPSETHQPILSKALSQLPYSPNPDSILQKKLIVLQKEKENLQNKVIYLTNTTLDLTKNQDDEKEGRLRDKRKNDKVLFKLNDQINSITKENQHLKQQLEETLKLSIRDRDASISSHHQSHSSHHISMAQTFSTTSNSHLSNSTQQSIVKNTVTPRKSKNAWGENNTIHPPTITHSHSMHTYRRDKPPPPPVKKDKEKKEDRKDEIRKALTEASQLNKIKQQSLDQVNKYQSMLEKKTQQIASLTSKIKQLEMNCNIFEHKNLQEKNDDLSTKFENKEKEYLMIQQENIDLYQSITNFQNLQNDYISQIESLKNQLNQYPNPQIIDNLKGEIDDLMTKTKRYQIKLREKEQIISELNNSLDLSKKTMIKRKPLRNDSDQIISDLKKENAEFQFHIFYGDQRKDEKISMLQDTITQLNSQLSHIQHKERVKNIEFLAEKKKIQSYQVEDWLFNDNDLAIYS